MANAGLAKKIRERWPLWYEFFLLTVPVLGAVSVYDVSENLQIASLYAQADFGRHHRHTNYSALASALWTLRRRLNTTGDGVYIPWGLGAGLGGGDWSIIKLLVEDALPDATLVRLPTRNGQ